MNAARSFIAVCGALLAVGLAAACYVGPVDGAAGPSAGRTSGVDAAAGGPGASGAGASGLPCDVDTLLTTHCAACHASTPLGAPVRLATYDDLVGPSKSDPSRKLAEVALARLQDVGSPMPPKPSAAPPAADIQALAAWIQAGYPHGTCGAGADAGPSPQSSTPVCTSGQYWSPATGREDESMYPGRACITCHESQTDDRRREKKGAILQLGGTVYPTFNEPQDCLGVDGTSQDVTVVITDAVGQTFTIPVTSTGSFGLRTRDAAQVRMPFRAKVVAGGKERVMTKAQTSGDCNACHTATGTNGAPGRITLP